MIDETIKLSKVTDYFICLLQQSETTFAPSAQYLRQSQVRTDEDVLPTIDKAHTAASDISANDMLKFTAVEIEHVPASTVQVQESFATHE